MSVKLAIAMISGLVAYAIVTTAGHAIAHVASQLAIALAR